MADSQDAETVYNSQLVRYFIALRALHNAEYGTQDAYTLYHIIQEESGKASSIGGGPALPALGHAVAGGAATAITKLLLYPLDLVTARMQVQRQLSGPKEAPSAARDADAEYTSLVDAARKIYADEGGLRAFYTGCAPDVVKGLADSFLFFLAYTVLRQYELKRHGDRLPVSRELGVGVLAGALSKLVTTPLQTVITRQQTAALVSARDPTSTTSPGESDKLTIKDIALQIRSERGLQGFWAGYSASLILTLNPAITFAVDNALQSLLPKSRRENPGAYLKFLIAASSKAIATSITYPVSLAKSRAQVSGPTKIAEAEGTEKDEGHATARRSKMTNQLKKAFRLLSAQYAIVLSLRKIYQSEGVGGLYSGLEAEVLKGFLSHGLTMTMKDRVHVGVIQLYYILLKLTRRWPAELQNAKQTAEDGLHKAQETATHAAGELKERAENVGATVVEEGKQIVDGMKKE